MASSVDRRKDGMLAKFKSVCSNLLSSRKLPYNPYPALVKGLTELEQQIELEEVDISSGTDYFNQSVKTLGTTDICMSKTTPAIYGLGKIISYVKVSALLDSYEFIQQIRPTDEFIQSNEESYEFDVAIALTGEKIFQDVLFTHATTLEIRMHYVAYQDSNPDVSVYSAMADNIGLHIEYLSSLEKHLFIGVTVEKSDGKSALWTPDLIENDSDRFFSAIKNALSSRGNISSEMVLVNEKGDGNRAKLLYCLTNVLERRDRDGEIESKTCRDYTTIPLQSFYDGFFLTQTDTETYAGAYLSSLIETDEEPETIREITDELITEVIHESWTSAIDEGSHADQYYDVILPLTLCVLHKVGLQRGDEPSDVLKEICRALRGKGGQLHHLMSEGRQLLNFLSDLQTTTHKILVKLLTKATKRYVENLKHFLAVNFGLRTSEGEEHNSDTSWTKLVNNELELLLAALESKNMEEMKTTIRAAHSLLLPVRLSLIEGTTTNFVRIQTALKSIHNRVDADEVTSLVEILPDEPEITYGVEGGGLENRRTSTISLLGVTKDKQAETFMSYIMENHLYATWQEVMRELSEGAENPLQIAVDKFRQAALKMEMCGRRPIDIQRQILQNAAYDKVVINPEIFICRAGSEKIFGLRSALSNLNVNTVRELLALVRPLRLDTHTQAGMTIQSSQSLSGSASQYGNVMGYLNKLEITEYWLTDSIANNVENTIQGYAKTILQYIDQLKTKGNLVCRLKVGEREWHLRDIETTQDDIITHLIESMSLQEAVVITVFIKFEWRYLSVDITVCPLAVDSSANRVFRFHSQSQLDQYIQIFPEQDAISQYMSLQRLETDNMDPYSSQTISKVITEIERKVCYEYKTQNYLNAMSVLLIKSNISQGTTQSSLVEAHAMFNSVAAELDFARQLCADLLWLFESAISDPSTISLKALSRHFTHFQRLLLKVTNPDQVPTAFTAKSLKTVLQRQMSELMNVESESATLILSKHGLEILQDILMTLRSLGAELSYVAFYALCPKSAVAVKSMSV